MHVIRLAFLPVLLLIAGTVTAAAHAKMASSVPEDGATVPAGLSEVQLDFSKPMRLTAVHVTRTGDKQEVAAKGKLPASFQKSAKIALDPLPTGAYEVHWSAVADDGHVMDGTFKFTVTEAKATAPSQ